MDPVSQAVLGGSWAQIGAKRSRLVAALAIGGFAAMTPDLDTLIASADDPLLVFEYHRQFSHSFVFIPFGALLCAALAHPAARRIGLRFLETYLYCFLGIASHGLLDACTTYGTQLLWPFSDRRIAWSVVAVLDPAFTAPVGLLVALAAWRRKRSFAIAAALWAFLYLAFGAVQSSRAEAQARALAASRGHAPMRLEATPALWSIFLWKTMYEFAGRHYVDAVRTGIEPKVFPGGSVPTIDVARDFPWLAPHSRQAADIERYRRISAGFMAVDPLNPHRIIDLRYSMVPNEIGGFWAVVLDPAAGPDEHVGYVTTRETAASDALRMLDMLF
jgi:inner membrane protein